MSDTANAHEERARATKAFKLTTICRRYGIDSAEALTFADEQWRIVAGAAGVNPPSATTIGLVLTWLKESEKTCPQSSQPTA